MPHVVFTVPLNQRVGFGWLRVVPWTVFVVLLVSVFVQIIVNGYVEQHDWLDALAMGTVIGLPVSAAAGVASTWWFRRRAADVFAREVQKRGGVTVTRAEALLLIGHAVSISTHWSGASQIHERREPPPEYDVPLSAEPATSLHLSYRHPAGYQMTVVGPRTGHDAAGDGCEICRAAWGTAGRTIEQLGVSPHLQTYLFRCDACRTYWESVVGSYPRPISARKARRLRDAEDFEPY